MTVITDFPFLTEIGSPKTSEVFVNAKAESATLQFAGSFTSGSFVVEGITNQNGDEWTALAGIRMSDYSVHQSITEKGIYSYGVEGIRQMRVRCTAVSGGTASAWGRMVRTV